MNRAYFAGNYYTGAYGTGRSNLITSPVPILWAWSRFSAPISANFLIDTSGQVLFIGNDISALGHSGTNLASSTTTPISIARPGSYTSAICAASFNSAFLDGSDGSIWVCGFGSYLGNNTTTTVSSPVSLARPGSYSAIFCGSTRGFWAIEGSTGTVYGWGYNNNGALGDNTKTTRSSPVSLARPGSYKMVNGSMSHTLFIDGATGNIWSSGLNTSGQLGNNTLNSTSSPVSIARPGSYSSVVVSTNIGGDPTSLISSSYALDAATGNIWAWGDNTVGQLGNNSMTGTSSPVSIARPGSYSAISAYDYVVAAIDASDGSLWSWGLNALGNIGDGTTISRSSPVSVLGGRSYISVAVGSTGTYAMTSDGTIYCIGLDSSNYFGRQATIYTTSLIPVLSALSFTKINSSIYLDSSGNVYCSGSGGAGSLGNNTMDDSVSPVSIARPGSYTDIAMTFLANSGVTHTLYTACAAIDGATGNIWIWGHNFRGQLGNNTMTSTSSPVSIARPGSYSTISGSVGGNFAAIEASTGNVYVWGHNGNGQLGINSLTATSSPVSIARPGSYSYVYASYFATLFIDGATGRIYGSGSNSSGQLGNLTIATRSSPVSLARPGSYKMAVMCMASSYAIDASDGSLWAWGANTIGQLGDGTLAGKSSPVSVLGARSYVSLLGSANSSTVFMLDSSGTIWALGDNSNGQFGNGTTVSASSPISLAIQSVKFINKTSNPGTLLTIDAEAPVVDTQPSNATKVQGETVQFTVAAHGNPSL